ncbi:HET-domain-containing protein, partial [Acephala macrosclerotiorum]
PTRVLDLESSNFTVKIWVASPGSFGEYVCLSHCWGDHQPLRTLSNNLELFKENIPWISFPKTFQDAIVFARSLDFKYLWIDSLCIIQDDTGDWQKEAANMASVYKNSSLTLAATGSPNCDSGLFHKYPDPQIHTLTVPDTNDYPLLHRAWAFQERLLSTRVLHFCKTELVWECMETWTCQCGSFYPSQNLKKSIAGHKQPEVDTVVAEESTSLGSWANIVEGYTKLDLTYESDRLPALAGLAEHIHHGHRGRYLAGLWEDSLAKDLVWHRLTWDPDRDYPRPSNSTLPTWSWASISDRIYY